MLRMNGLASQKKVRDSLGTGLGGREDGLERSREGLEKRHKFMQ